MIGVSQPVAQPMTRLPNASGDSPKIAFSSWPWLITVLMLPLLSSCGGGSGEQNPPTPPAAESTELRLRAADLADAAVAVPRMPTFMFTFDASLSPSSAASSVTLLGADGPEPVEVDVLDDTIRVRVTRQLRMRADYRLTVSAGLRGSDGRALRQEISRRFRTRLFDAHNVLLPKAENLRLWNAPPLRVADVNGDRLPDIIEVTTAPITAENRINDFIVVIRTQRPDGQFVISQQVLVRENQHSSAVYVRDLALLDLDRDGLPEILIGLERSEPYLSEIKVLRQGGEGIYREQDAWSTDAVGRFLFADINGDGQQDMLAIGARLDAGGLRILGCRTLAVVSGSGGPVLRESEIPPCNREDIALGPLDRTAALHLVTNWVISGPLVPDRQEVRVYRLDARGVPSIDDSFAQALVPIGAGFRSCEELHLIDVDGNGSKELMFSFCRPPENPTFRTITVYARAADGIYAEWTRQSLGPSFSFLIADMDRDGREDVMATVQTCALPISCAS